jgi:uncharacterized radical SAM superfamily Fe-S cluster-containing enzyme
MISKQQFEASVFDEIRIIKHLATKVLPGTQDWRPTPKQRSILELMQYLSQSAATFTEVILEANTGIFQERSEAAKSVTPENFTAAMDAQAEKLKELFAKFDDAELTKEVDLWGSGHPQTKAEYLLNGMLKGMTAYRMQLFLYIKASGREDIGTSDVWQGVDGTAK